MPSENGSQKQPSAREELLARVAADKAAQEKAAADAADERRVRNALLLRQSHDLRTRAKAAMSDKALMEPLNVKDAYRDAIDDVVGAVIGGKKGLRRDTRHSEVSEVIREHFYPDGQHGPLRQEDEALWAQAERALREEKTNVGAEARAAGKERRAMRTELSELTDAAQKYGNDSMVTSNLAAARGELQKKSPQYAVIGKKRNQRIAESDDREINEPRMVTALQAEIERERQRDEAWLVYQKAQIATPVRELEHHFNRPLLPEERAIIERIKRLRQNIDRCDHPKKTGLIFRDALFLHDLPRDGMDDEYKVPMSELPRKRAEFAQDLEEQLRNARRRRARRAEGANSFFKEVLDAASNKINELWYKQPSHESRARRAQAKTWQNIKVRDEYATLQDDFVVSRLAWYKQAKLELEQIIADEINRVADAWYKRNFGE